MQIKKDGIYKNIDAKDFGYYQAMGFEKVIVEEKQEPVIVEIEPVKTESVEQTEPIEELPKSKKRKKKAI